MRTHGPNDFHFARNADGQLEKRGGLGADEPDEKLRASMDRNAREEVARREALERLEGEMRQEASALEERRAQHAEFEAARKAELEAREADLATREAEMADTFAKMRHTQAELEAALAATKGSTEGSVGSNG